MKKSQKKSDMLNKISFVEKNEQKVSKQQLYEYCIYYLLQNVNMTFKCEYLSCYENEKETKKLR